MKIPITIQTGAETHQLEVEKGANLRTTLMEAGFSPYAKLTQKLNCGGRGLCATCGVWIEEEPAPEHWHDRIGSKWGYPRLSCQITIITPLTIRLVTDKKIWGKRKK